MRSAFRNKLTAFAAVCGLAALTAACDGVVVVSQVYSTQSQLDNNVGSFSYFATMTPIAVYVRGSPFANDPNNEGVAAALQRTSSIPNLRFVGAATPPTTGYVVVMARGQFLPNVNYCNGRTDFPLSGSNGNDYATTLCVNGQLSSQARVSGPMTREPSDPGFVAMMTQLRLALFR